MSPRSSHECKYLLIAPGNFQPDLSAAVDVYSDWVDACDAVAKDTANQYDGAVGSIGNSKSDALANAGHGDAYEDDDDY